MRVTVTGGAARAIRLAAYEIVELAEALAREIVRVEHEICAEMPRESSPSEPG